MRRAVSLAAVPFFITLLASCGGNPIGPEPNSLVGPWEATSFALVQGSNSTDVHIAGGSMTITLTSDNRTSGSLVIPASLNGGITETFDMAGTWTQNADTVEFNQNADTFVRDAVWLSSGGQLLGLYASGSDSVKVTLERK